MEALVASLMLWISANSAYDTTGMPPPAVIHLSPRQMTAEYYDAAGVALAKRPEIDERILALYDFERGPQGTIFVLAPALVEGAREGEDHLENPIFQEMLLHELVHHAQRLSGAYARFACRAEGEYDAYMLGGLFLRQRHAPDPLWNRAVLANLYSRC